MFDFYCKNGLFWIKIFKWILSIKDIRQHRLYFSERNGYTKHKIIGNYSICIKRFKTLNKNEIS